MSARAVHGPDQQVETTLFRALIVLRAVVTTYMVVLNLLRLDEFARPGLALAVVVGLVGWSIAASWAYDRPDRRRAPLYLADVAVAVAAILSTPLVQSQEMLDRHASTVPSFWVMSSVLAWAVGRHWLQAVCAAVVVSVADLSVRAEFGGATWGNIFLLVLAAAVIGWTAGLLREAALMRAAAERAAAAQAERARLARVVHDGVLQVLSMVQRRAAEAGSPIADLGPLAAEQEAGLRALVNQEIRTRRLDDATADLMSALEPLAGSAVTVSGPAAPVLLDAHRVAEVSAAVRACLDNVRTHVGAEAPAWVLVEDGGDEVVVSVRDEGPGIPPGRLDQATREGRLGVAESIRGRVEDLGGRTDLTTGPRVGTEWELVVPRAPRGEP